MWPPTRSPRRAIVRASFDGVVAKRFHNPGDLVEPSASDPVLRVVDPDRLEVVASIPLADAPRVTMGAIGHLAGGSTGRRPRSRSPSSHGRRRSMLDTATVPVRLGFAARVNIPVGAPVQVAIDAEQHAMS